VNKLDSELQHLDLIDLISERHLQLRQYAENEWNERHDLYLSNSEWFILSRIYQKEDVAISAVSKSVNISRQATHKLIKRLEEKELVEITSLENNRKQKAVKLTTAGKEAFETNETLKADLEQRISRKIGADQVKILKEILNMDWGF
jgi:DNA-binding MarR family transcriptional regulator